MRKILLFLLLFLPAAGQDMRQVVVRTNPPGAEVYRVDVSEPGDGYLGVSGEQPILLPVGDFEVVISLDGHAPYKGFVKSYHTQNGVWPEPPQPAIELSAQSPLVALRDAWQLRPGLVLTVALGVLGVLAGGLGLVVSRRERQRQARTIEELESVQEAGGDNLLGRLLPTGHRLTTLLGVGGFGKVYLADGPDEQAAVKIPFFDWITDPRDLREAQGRFDREIAICARMSHPNIVRIYDWGQEENFHYFVMEYLEGKTLKASLEEWEQTGRPQLGSLYRLAEQLFAGLCYAHHKGVAHRDIKPENIMLRDSGRLKLMDFGAAWGDKFVEVTRTGGGVCSLLYAAPECINPAAAKGKRDFRAFDQFSLGVVLYEMLAGVRPFADHDLLKMTPARPVRQHNPEVPEQLERVLARMLAFRPEQRFDDLHEARRAFEAAVSQLV